MTEELKREDELGAEDWAAVVTAAKKAVAFYYEEVNRLGGGIDAAYFPIKIEVLAVNGQFEYFGEKFVLDDHPKEKIEEDAD